jgi:uncharacterized OB-fold protein
MSSEPIERRVSYLGDRLRGNRCLICGKEYFEIRDYCGNCGRKSYGKMVATDLFYEKGTLELCTLVNEPTNKFTKLGNYIYGIVSFHDGKIRVPGRLTDRMPKCNEDIDLHLSKDEPSYPGSEDAIQLTKATSSPQFPSHSLLPTNIIHIRSTSAQNRRKKTIPQASSATEYTLQDSESKKETSNVQFPSSTRTP